MESLSVKHMISAIHSAFPKRSSTLPTHFRRFTSHYQRVPFLLCSKKFDFQDFQDYAKPLRLVPATQIEVCQDLSVEKVISSLNTGTSDAIYKVKIQTSKSYGSGLTDMNSAVQLCLIDENGDSILQRVPASLIKDPSFYSENGAVPYVSTFQQGSADEFMFEGPLLGKLTALWIGVESGQWRVGGVTLTTLSQNHTPLAESDEEHMQCIGYQYNFKIDDVLLGEGTGVSMWEVRPSHVSQFSGDSVILLNENSPQPFSLANFSASKEESMKEYADLKLSLLLYDAALVVAGSTMASLLGGENAADAFLVGGLGGFLYLILLQRSVDELPATELISRRSIGNSDKWLGRLKGAVSSLVFAIVFSKLASGAGGKVLTPQEVVSGMTGFLMCKVAVVLAAFKPVPLNLREEE